MIKQGLKNYFKSLRHFFTPLGTMFLGIMLGLSVAAADTVTAASALTEGIKSLADNINLDFKNLLDGIWLQITALDWENNPASAIQTLFSAEWLNGVLSNTLQALLGTDFDTFTQEITLLVTTFTSRIAANIAVFFTFWILGFFAGLSIIKLLIRRDIAKRSVWKYVLAYFIDGLLSTAFVVLCLFVFTLWQASIYISLLIILLLIGALALIEAYLLHGFKKVKLGVVLNIKNIALYMLTNAIIFLISIIFTIAAIAVNSLMGLFVGLSLTIIAFIVISLNAESYVLSVANTPILEENKSDTVQNDSVFTNEHTEATDNTENDDLETEKTTADAADETANTQTEVN